jgi:hypothetical protein
MQGSNIKKAERKAIVALTVCLGLTGAATLPAQGAEKKAASDGTMPTALNQDAPNRSWHLREGLRFKRNWGVDIEGVKVVSSGYMLAFRYRVMDEEKAKALNEKTSRPYLIDEATGIRLAVPAMEKVGELRQSVKPEAGRRYFIIFGNPGKVVKPGSRVSVVIGNFQADGLVAQ